MEKKFNPKNPDWSELYENYWVNKTSKWVVRDYHSTDCNDLNLKWVIFDDMGMMISCEYREEIASCMEEADRICNEIINEPEDFV